MTKQNRRSMAGAANPAWRGGRFVGANGYVHIHAPLHPRSSAAGYVYEHTLVVENALGHLLPVRAVVHHVNENKQDNRSQNLVVCNDRAYHMLLHARQRALDACGNANWRQCVYCGDYDDPPNLTVIRSCWKAYHRRCRAAHAYAKRHARDEAVA